MSNDAEEPAEEGAYSADVLYELADGVATLTLNRPHRKNAWTIEMQALYYGLLEQCEGDDEVRAIVVTGAGNSFCPGVDTEALQEYSDTGDFNPDADAITQPDSYPFDVRKPLIAAINGACAGFGLVQALMCDVRIGAAGARMSTAFARRGLPALHGVAWLLPRLVGTSRATELILSGRTFLCDEAAEIGLLHQLVPADEVLATAQAYAADLVTNCSPTSWVNMKAQLRLSDHQTLEESIEEGLGREKIALSSADFAEGIMSFVERRPPRFGPADLG
ncbi:MAG: enoyl-CoA hydratase-related protein [Actinomycetota bacterium]|nr:enoyl-CoA hydratase-related protein [Actinomycetota bacterium]